MKAENNTPPFFMLILNAAIGTAKEIPTGESGRADGRFESVILTARRKHVPSRSFGLSSQFVLFFNE
jgi:hypothetical protein